MRISQISLVCIYISLIFVYPYKIAASGEESIEISQSEKKSAKESATPAEKTAQYYIELGKRHSRMGLKYSNIPDRERANAESKKAAVAYQKALELEPENIKIYGMLSAAYSNSQQKNKAIEITEKAIKLQPDDPELYLDLGYFYYYSDYPDKYERAIKALQRAINLKSDYQEAHFQLGLSYMKLKRFKEAEEQKEILLDMDDENATYSGELLEKLIIESMANK